MALDSLFDIKDLEKKKFLDNGAGDVTVRVLDSVSNSLAPNVFDYVALTYTDTDLTGVVYKTGGSGGTTISTLTLSYSVHKLISVTKA